MDNNGSANDPAGSQRPYNYGTPGSPPPPPPPPPPYPYPPCNQLGAGALKSCLISGCVTLLVPCLLLGGFFCLLFLLLSSGVKEAAKDGGAWSELYQLSSPDFRNLRERTLRAGKSGAGSVAVVAVTGVIGGRGSALHGDSTLEFVAQQLRAAGKDDDVKAVILQVDSPGGGLSASDQLYHEVEVLKKKGKPVLAWAGGMMASGGYYIAAAADEIMASPTATLGSIGVILQHVQVQEMLGKIGVRVNPITSGPHKDLGSPFREMTPEEEKILQEYIDISYQRFVEIVAKGRKMPADRVREIADGRIFGPDQAKADGLVDSIGYIEDAIAWAEKKTGEEEMRVIGYKRVVSLSELFGEAGGEAGKALLKSLVETEAEGSGAMAVWR